MRIDVALIVIVLAIVLFVALVISANYGKRGQDPSSFPLLYWIGLTVVTLTAGGMAAFVGVNVLYFVGGQGAGAVGLVVSGAFFVATPIAWAAILRRRQRNVSAHH
jgi:hypothetical protein